jgi:hypothetical protein
MVKLPKVIARPDDHYMIICPGYWGKGETLAAARKALPFSLDEDRWVIQSVHPSTRLDGDGYLVRDGGTHAPLELARS